MVVREMERQDTAQYKGVSLTDFADTIRVELGKRTAEDVVEYLIKDEVKRTENMTDDKEKEVRITYKTAIPEILSGIEALAKVKNRGIFLIMKCLAHKGVYMLRDIPGLWELNEQYADLVRLNGHYGGLTRLLKQVRLTQYSPISTDKQSGEFHMAKKLKSTYGSMGEGLGVDLYLITAIGLGLPLTYTAEPDLLGIAEDIQKEVDAFKIYVRDRALMMDAYWKIAYLHLQDDGKIENIPKAIGMSSGHTKGGKYE